MSDPDFSPIPYYETAAYKKMDEAIQEYFNLDPTQTTTGWMVLGSGETPPAPGEPYPGEYGLQFQMSANMNYHTGLGILTDALESLLHPRQTEGNDD